MTYRKCWKLTKMLCKTLFNKTEDSRIVLGSQVSHTVSSIFISFHSLINSFSLSSIVFVRLMKKCLRMTIFIIQHFLASIPRISSARAQMGLPGSNGKSRIEFTLLFFRDHTKTHFLINHVHNMLQSIEIFEGSLKLLFFASTDTLLSRHYFGRQIWMHFIMLHFPLIV